MVAGIAALADYAKIGGTTKGVPLGVIAVISLVWALWGRRSRLGIIQNLSYSGVHSTYALTPVTNLSDGSSQKPQYSRHLVLGPAELYQTPCRTHHDPAIPQA